MSACGGTTRNAPGGGDGGGSGGTASVSGHSGSGSVAQGGTAACQVTPVSGRWLAYVAQHPYRDPFVIDLRIADDHVVGEGCIAGPPFNEEPLLCGPVRATEDHGRKLDFSWDLTQGPRGVAEGYLAEFQLTLSPERTVLAGTFRLSEGAPLKVQASGLDALFVRAPGEPIPEATSCSGGLPAGDCFLGPLRADYVMDDSVASNRIGDADILLSWTSRRATEERIAAARFDAATGAWGRAQFLDVGRSEGRRSVFASNGREIVAAFRSDGALLVRHYDLDADAWSEPEVAMAGAATHQLVPESMVIDNGGNVTLVATTDTPGQPIQLFASEYAASASAWSEPRLLGETNQFDGVALAGDASGNVVVAWLEPEYTDEDRFVLWFSRRRADDAFSAKAVLTAGDRQILRPQLAAQTNGTVVATWQEPSLRIASRALPLDSESWDEVRTVTSDPNAENRRLTVGSDSRVLAHFYRTDTETYHVAQLDASGWSAPATSSREAARAESHVVTVESDRFRLANVDPGDAIPVLPRESCAGY